MNPYVTGTMIKQLREGRGLTQQQLARELSVSDKAVSKWETGRGYPDISLMEPLAAALGVSVMELMSGEQAVNTNGAGNMQRLKIHVCPLCGNVIVSLGAAIISCHGILLPALEPETLDEEHRPTIQRVEDEYFVSLPHEMTKTHHLSFLLAVRDEGWEVKKLYAEGPAEARFPVARTKCFYLYCNRHGLFRLPIQ